MAGKYTYLTDPQVGRLVNALGPFFAGEEQEVLIRGYDLMLSYVEDRVGALPASLVSMGNAVTSANNILYTIAPGVFSNTALSPYMREALSKADAASIRSYIGASGLIASTDDVTEGALNKYYTDVRVDLRGSANNWIVNPMTTLGDLIIGGVSGVATRFAPGTNGQTLTIVSGVPTWQTPVSSGVPDGDKGDVVVSGSGAVWNIDNGVVTTAKLGGDITAAGKALLDDATVTDQRTTLGLGDAATQSASSLRDRSTHTGTQLASTISDFSTAADARITAAVGTSIQAFDGDLAAIAALGGTSGLARKTAANTWSLDTSTYLTGNQTITISGDASGAGATGITLTLTTVNASPQTDALRKITVNGKGLVTATTAVTGADLPSHNQTLSTISDVSITASNLNLLDDGADTTLHFHASDRNRANHTGAQTSSTISDFNAASRAQTEAELVAGANITLTPAGAGATRTITIASTGGGGGGSPGGSTTQVQYNNAGAFDGATGVGINASELLQLEGYFDQAASGIPASPAAGYLRWFSRSRAGRLLPHIVGPSGIDTAMQPALFGNTVYMWLPGVGTTASIAWGTTWAASNSGTGAAQAHPVKTSTNALNSLNRATFGTGTTATGTSGMRSANTIAWRGNAAGLGGFFYFSRFAVETHEASMQYFNGLSAQSAAWSVDPSTVANTIGIGKDAADSNWFLIERNATTATKTNTGLAVAAGTILDFTMFAPPNSSTVTCRLVNAVDGTVYVDNVVLNTTLPVNTTFLYGWHVGRSTVGLTSKLFALNRIYLESDL